MNIIKFKDIILTTDNAPQLTEKQRRLFNEKYKGKYTYAIDWEDVVALEDMTEAQYVNESKNKYTEETVAYYKKIKFYDQLLDSNNNIDTSKEYYIAFPYGLNSFLVSDYDSQKLSLTSTEEDISLDIESEVDSEHDSCIVNECSKFKIIPSDPYIKICENNINEILTRTVYEPARGSLDLYFINSSGIEKYCDVYLYDTEYEEGKFEHYHDVCHMEVYDGRNYYFENVKDFVEGEGLNKIWISVENDDGTREILKYDLLTSSNVLEKPFMLKDLNSPYLDDFNCILYGVSDSNTGLVTRATSSIESNPSSYPAFRYCWMIKNESNPDAYGSNNSKYFNDTILYPYASDLEQLNNNFYGDHALCTINKSTSSTTALQNYKRNNNICAYPKLYSREERVKVVINPDYLNGFDTIPFDLLQEYTDPGQTINANSVISFLAANKYTSDEDITVDELKKFRTWLATYLLAFDQDSQERQQYQLFDDDTTHMLLYYKNEMYDGVIKYLSKFSNQSITLISTVSSCGCNSLGTVGGTTVKTLPHSSVQLTSCGCNTNALSGNQVLSNCDPIGIYRKNIYKKMVDTFSIIEFWTQFSDDFLKDFKRYIDGIIKLNLPLHTDTFISSFADCGCLNQADAEQQKNISILKDLSKSLEYMISDEYGEKHITNNKNFIQGTLQSWSSLLYESMRWYN